MVDLCEFLTVKRTDADITGFVVESCGDFNGDLSQFCLVLEPDKIVILEDWIRRNIRNNVDHCIMMLKDDPSSTFGFLMRVRDIQSATGEFVSELGGIQEFLDKYSGPKSDDSEEDRGVSELPNDEPEPAESSDESEPAESSDEQEPTESSDEPVAIEGGVTCENEKCTEIFDSQESTEESGTAEVTHTETIVEEKIIHRTVRTIMDYDASLIEDISDGQIADSLEKLKELNDKIALGGLDPKYVLTDNDLEKVYRKIYTYPSEVFKSFMLSYLKSVNSETERFRISAVMDDFLKFVKG